MRSKIKNVVLSLALAVLLVSSSLVFSACTNVTTTEVSTYEQLSTALSSTCDVIKLTDNIVAENIIIVERKVVLDLNGNTITNEKGLWNEETHVWSLISVRGDGDLTITGNGKVLAKEGDVYGIDTFDANSKLTIKNGEVVGNITAVYCHNGSVKIEDGKFSVQQKNTNKVEGPYGSTINILNKNGTAGTATVELTGGVYVNFNPADKTVYENWELRHNPNDKLVADGYTAKLIDGTTNYQVVKAED